MSNIITINKSVMSFIGPQEIRDSIKHSINSAIILNFINTSAMMSSS